jgi:hypothetical protein
VHKQPFCAAQFTATHWDSAQDKAKWANAMALWAKRGFPRNGWRKGLYGPLTHMYGHIAHFNQDGFYEVWFADIHCRLRWLQYAARGGAFAGGAGDPAYTWSDVEQALRVWIRNSGLIAHYQQICSQDIEAKERAQLAYLQRKYPDNSQTDGASGDTIAPVSAPSGRMPHSPSPVRTRSKKPQKPCYVRFSLFE